MEINLCSGEVTMYSELQKFSDELAAAVEKAARSVVSVDARHHVPGGGIVWNGDGEILTADHILQHDDQVSVILPDGAAHPAKVLGRDAASDLALLKVDASG